MMDTSHGISRRRALQILGSVGAVGLAGCSTAGDLFSGDDDVTLGEQTGVTPRDPPSESPDTTVDLTAAPYTGDGSSTAGGESWLYNDGLPGPEIRASEGDVVGVTLTNDLPEETTVHWHGLPVANPVDGVPGLTQDPVAPGDSFDYRFRAEPAGTYFYHSHAGLQLDRGLAGRTVPAGGWAAGWVADRWAAA